MSNIGAHDNHKLLSYHNNEPLQYDYHTIDIIAHHQSYVCVTCICEASSQIYSCFSTCIS